MDEKLRDLRRALKENPEDWELRKRVALEEIRQGLDEVKLGKCLLCKKYTVNRPYRLYFVYSCQDSKKERAKLGELNKQSIFEGTLITCAICEIENSSGVKDKITYRRILPTREIIEERKKRKREVYKKRKEAGLCVQCSGNKRSYYFKGSRSKPTQTLCGNCSYWRRVS